MHASEAVAMMLALSRTERDLVLETLRETLCLKCGDMTPERDCYCDYESHEYDMPEGE